MQIIATDTQSKWKDSYSSSAQVKLTLRTNGEEIGTVITPQGELYQAGFVAPTVAPTMALGSAGNVTGVYYYAYVYCSSKYSFVENDVTVGGGELWPRSNPSPVSASSITATADQVVVTVTKSTRSDVDYIAVYRTQDGLTADDALAAKEAGELWCVGVVANDGIAGTTTFTDNVLVNTGEALELDNFVCPLFRFNVFDGTYWWGFANTEFTALVDIDGTSSISLSNTDDAWFSGRDGSVCNFNGVISGGFDGKGSFYFKRVTATTGSLYLDESLTTLAAVSATGTTTIHIQTNPTTLYRSKARNPFSWGKTTTLFDQGSQTNVSELWSFKVGGGQGSGLSIIPNESVLKLDVENPSKCYAFDLTAADDDAFPSTQRILDDSYSTSSNFSQFAARLASGQTVLASTDGKTNQILQADSGSQIPVGTNVIRVLENLITSDDAPEFYHGIYDGFTELNCWWVKAIPSNANVTTYEDLVPRITHMIYQHAPTGKWGAMPDFDILCSATIYDPVERTNYTFTGDQSGNICRAFVPNVYGNMAEGETFKYGAVLSGNAAGWTTSPYTLINQVVNIASDGTGTISSASSNYVVGQYVSVQAPGLDSVKAYISAKAGSTTITNATYFNTGEPVTTAYSTLSGVNRKAHATSPCDQRISWWYLRSSDGLSGQWVKGLANISGGVTGYIFIDDNLTEVSETPQETVDSTWFWYYGMEPCRVLRYFDMGDPEKSKRLMELWMTQQNVDSSTLAQFARFYKEYEESPFTSITPWRDQRLGGSNSNVYLNKNQLPSDLLNSFGVEFLELGYDQYQLMNFTLKLDNT